MRLKGNNAGNVIEHRDVQLDQRSNRIRADAGLEETSFKGHRVIYGPEPPTPGTHGLTGDIYRVADAGTGSVRQWRCDSPGYQKGRETVAARWTELAGARMAEVAISAGEARAAEAGLREASFTVSRTGDTSEVLTVDYTVSGTARNGDDCVFLNGFVAIPAGKSSRTVAVRPVHDLYAEGEETLTVTLAAGSGYVVGGKKEASFTIADNPASAKKEEPPLPPGEEDTGTEISFDRIKAPVFLMGNYAAAWAAWLKKQGIESEARGWIEEFPASTLEGVKLVVFAYPRPGDPLSMNENKMIEDWLRKGGMAVLTSGAPGGMCDDPAHTDLSSLTWFGAGQYSYGNVKCVVNKPANPLAAHITQEVLDSPFFNSRQPLMAQLSTGISLVGSVSGQEHLSTLMLNRVGKGWVLYISHPPFISPDAAGTAAMEKTVEVFVGAAMGTQADRDALAAGR